MFDNVASREIFAIGICKSLFFIILSISIKFEKKLSETGLSTENLLTFSLKKISFRNALKKLKQESEITFISLCTLKDLAIYVEPVLKVPIIAKIFLSIYKFL
jgi:hypothetical protein